MKNKHVGFLIIGIAILLFVIVMSFNNALDQIVETTCTHGPDCSMHITLKTQKIISYSLMAILLVVGGFLAFMKDDKHVGRNLSSSQSAPKKKSTISLTADEKRIVDLLHKEQGSVYQSDLIKETKLSKVKMTRLLDKLEGKGLIERKRRGMTNVVLLK